MSQAWNCALVKLDRLCPDWYVKDHFIEMFRIYIEAHLLMVRRQLLSENFYQKNNFEIFVTYFGAFFPCFFTSFCVFHVKVTLEKYPKSPWHGKPRNWFFMYLVLLMSMWQWDSLVKRKEKSLHHKTKLEAAQLSCVRNDTERLWLIVEQHEQQA